ncbi:hypothetical protein JCM15457_1805 [Liquorilactobacillus sucicola DSM 21376 = JCM 15457]|uniref:Integral membrane protein n=1 Tax=Liquorilactobacillus sucicola DSM 21376 = JCM 15457 TaxID=1423806 RepID=A0A023CYH1_9LACO|nr:DUF1129 family protein [Liquorilactobacillus sucicola]KRN07518.1 hypothetical protein FD15_GL000801 [Liquorilactobacillus sucicola DSM 21376 = JCM 15457]GAJ26854.1 hypothetical protein JCM15457_1805 [Liquorilactobacillus sucicola DSM 21376 = JCM 15457]
MNKEDTRTKLLRDETNKLRKQLKEPNAIFFDDLRSYLITSGIFYAEEDVTEQIYNVCLDLIEAQENGQTAKEYFGKDSRKLANSMIKNFKKASLREMINITCIPIGIFWLITFFSDFANPGTLKINILEYFLMAVLSVALTCIVFSLVHKSVYLSEDNIFRKSKTAGFILGTAFFASFVLLFSAISFWTPAFLTIRIIYPYDTILILALAVVFVTWIISSKQIYLYPITPFVVLIAIVGIIQRIPVMVAAIGADNVKYLAIGAAVIGFLANIIWTRIQVKKVAND